MKKSQAVPLALTALMAASLTGCADAPEPDNYAICVDPQTELRVDDQRCDDGHSGGLVIEATFDEPLNDPLQGDTGVPCAMEAIQSVDVSFASGVNSGFNGTFKASASYKPTAINASNNRVTKATITVKGGSQFPNPSPATGSIKASFNVAFSGLGQRTDCYAGLKGVTTASSGAVVVQL